jgi:hypothetical protein
MDIRNDIDGGPAGRPGMLNGTAPRGQGKRFDDQIRELHRLVDGAMENLEQVHRALRYLDRDA